MTKPLLYTQVFYLNQIPEEIQLLMELNYGQLSSNSFTFRLVSSSRLFSNWHVNPK